MPTKKRFTDDSYRKEPWFRGLCSAFLACRSDEEMANMLRDVGTLSELQAWSERLEVAKQLARGLSYREVAKHTGASTTTVTRVAKFLENGTGGYRKYLKVHRHHRLLPRMPDSHTTMANTESAEALPERQAAPPSATTSVLQKYLQRPS